MAIDQTSATAAASSHGKETDSLVAQFRNFAQLFGSILGAKRENASLSENKNVRGGTMLRHKLEDIAGCMAAGPAEVDANQVYANSSRSRIGADVERSGSRHGVSGSVVEMDSQVRTPSDIAENAVAQAKENGRKDERTFESRATNQRCDEDDYIHRSADQPSRA
jgi:hypothetical protein